MEKREDLGHYLAFNGSLAERNAFSNPDDYLTFAETYVIEIAADAWQGYCNHGRGIVLLQGPFDSAVPLIKSFYATCDPEDFEGFSRPDLARQDCEGYDPEREIVVGFTDPAENFLRFWRATPGIMTPPEAFDAVMKKRRDALAAVAPQRGESRTPPIRRRFWDRPGDTRPSTNANRRHVALEG